MYVIENANIISTYLTQKMSLNFAVSEKFRTFGETINEPSNFKGLQGFVRFKKTYIIRKTDV